MINYEKEAGIYSVEEADEIVVQKNLKKMNGEMMELLMSESIGGNAGTVEVDGKEYVCAAANGYADRETGEIYIFENYQNIPENIKDKQQHFLFRVAIVGKYLESVNTNNDRPRIIDFIEKERFSERGRLSIQEAIDRFNVDE
jgi:hypothetical protein